MVNTMKRIRHIIDAVRWVLDMKRAGMTFEEISDTLDWHAALERAVQRYPGMKIRETTDPCTIGRCKWFTAIMRCHVRYYLGTENPPAPGSSYSTHEHWADVVKEIWSMGFPDAPRCADCERLWAPSRCGCRGACSPRGAA
jgi:hypothetical protein